jgi:rhodanese-related sulfurtransferase/DNA-binding transcriptional ArsR family regulator
LHGASPKPQLLQLFAQVGKAVASPARLELLELLAQGEKTVDVLARQANLTVKNASSHLRALRAARLVQTRKEGTFVHYSLSDETVHEFVRSLQMLAARRLAEVREIVRDYYRAPEALEAIAADELAERLRTGDATLVDVRPAEEFAAGHIAGAVSIPVGELEQRLAHLPADLEVVAYCRGPYCVLARTAVDVLRAHGFRARRLEEGVMDWRRLGFAVSTGTAA